MDKTILKQKLEDTKTKLKANSKDAHFADALINDLISLKGQIDHEPTLEYIPLSDIDQQADGDTFTMAVTKSGDVVYKVYGGYTMIADTRIASLNETIRGYIGYMNGDIEIPEDQKEDYELALVAIRYVLSAPMYAFADPELMYTIAADIARWINTTAEKLMSEELHEENVEENIAFEKQFEAVSAVEERMKSIPES